MPANVCGSEPESADSKLEAGDKDIATTAAALRANPRRDTFSKPENAPFAPCDNIIAALIIYLARADF